MTEFNAQKISKVKAFNPDASFTVGGTDGGTFAIASSKKELQQLMKSDADVVYGEKKGKLFLNDNGTAKGWGEKKVGGLVAKFRDKPEPSADNFESLAVRSGDAVIGDGEQQGGDIQDRIASLREGLTESKVSELYGEMLIDPKKGIKSISKTAKKEGDKFNKAEFSTAIDE